MKNNEKTLGLKELAPYLPYKLKINHFGKPKVMVCGSSSSTHWIGIKAVLNGQNHKPEMYRPLLHPLERLTQPIEHDGETFIPTELLDSDDYPIDFFVDTEYEYMVDWIGSYQRDHHILFLPWGLINQLIEWHFDVFNLIPLGLAEAKPLEQ